MKRLLAVAIFTVISVCFVQAQGFDNFWHPRQVQTLKVGTSTAAYVWEFKPTFQVSATVFRQSADPNKSFVTSLLSAAGPALTYQHEGQLADGTNYADYAVSLAFLLSGTSDMAPFVQPKVALTGGFLNNVFQIGVGYDFYKDPAAKNQIFFLINLGINITNN